MMQTSNENSKVRLNAKPGLARNCFEWSSIKNKLTMAFWKKKSWKYVFKNSLFCLKTVIQKTCSKDVQKRVERLEVGIKKFDKNNVRNDILPWLCPQANPTKQRFLT